MFFQRMFKFSKTLKMDQKEQGYHTTQNTKLSFPSRKFSFWDCIKNTLDGKNKG